MYIDRDRVWSAVDRSSGLGRCPSVASPPLPWFSLAAGSPPAELCSDGRVKKVAEAAGTSAQLRGLHRAGRPGRRIAHDPAIGSGARHHPRRTAQRVGPGFKLTHYQTKGRCRQSPRGGLLPAGRRRPVPTSVLHLTYMETIGVRELQQHASAALRRVARGETIGVTERGRLVAVLTAPSAATGAAALVASGRVLPARRAAADLPPPATASRSVAEVLDELRGDR